MSELLQLPLSGHLVKMVLAALVGAAIGFERELRGHAAGLRTMILVCLGSTLAMVVSAELSDSRAGGVPVDPGRIAAGIVTGVGFLGAGVIVKLGDVVRGVTTAAAIWFVAAIGIAIGAGQFGLTLEAVVLALIVLALLRYPERLLKGHVYRMLTITAEPEHAREVIGSTRSLLETTGQTILDMQGSHDVANGVARFEFYVRTTQDVDVQRVLNGLSQLEGVSKVSWKPPRV